MSIQGIKQLKSLTFHYCNSGGSSKGVLNYIRGPLIKFAEKNPDVEIKTSHRPQKHPYLIASYVSGKDKPIPLLNMDVKEVSSHVDAARNSAGRKQKIIKNYNVAHTKVNSIQGEWNESLEVKNILVEKVEREDLVQYF